MCPALISLGITKLHPTARFSIAQRRNATSARFSGLTISEAPAGASLRDVNVNFPIQPVILRHTKLNFPISHWTTKSVYLLLILTFVA